MKLEDALKVVLESARYPTHADEWTHHERHEAASVVEDFFVDNVFDDTVNLQSD